MNKTVFSIFFLLAISFKANAMSQAQACNLLKQIPIEMNVVASNIVNVTTTRTPEGGPYQIKRFKCHSGKCDIASELKIKRVYEPNHPDANGDGYVAYPDIKVVDQEIEMDQLTRAYDEAAKICSKQI